MHIWNVDRNESPKRKNRQVQGKLGCRSLPVGWVKGKVLVGQSCQTLLRPHEL